MIQDFIWLGLIPVIYILSGVLLYKCPPAGINSVYGYRTARSTTNQEIFREGNRYAGKTLINTGLIYISITIFMIGMTIEFNNLYWITYWGIIGLSLILFMLTYIRTEAHLKKIIEGENNNLSC